MQMIVFDKLEFIRVSNFCVRRKMEKIFLRKIEDYDVSTFQKWLYCEHVAKWYTEPIAYCFERVRIA